MIPDVASDLEAGPGRFDHVRVDPFDDDELLSTRGAGDDPDIPASHLQLVRDEPEERRVGRTIHGWGRHPGAQHAIHDAIDAVSRSPRRETDGEADVGGAQDLRRRATASQVR
jgi:hypothetical protein